MGSFRGVLIDERGSVSSKRLVGIVAAFTLIGSFALHVIVLLIIALVKQEPPAAPDVALGGIIAGLAFGALGLSSVDKHSPWPRQKPPFVNNEPRQK